MKKMDGILNHGDSFGCWRPKDLIDLYFFIKYGVHDLNKMAPRFLLQYSLQCGLSSRYFDYDSIDFIFHRNFQRKKKSKKFFQRYLDTQSMEFQQQLPPFEQIIEIVTNEIQDLIATVLILKGQVNHRIQLNKKLLE
jgi:hypothetical protein